MTRLLTSLSIFFLFSSVLQAQEIGPKGEAPFDPLTLHQVEPITLSQDLSLPQFQPLERRYSGVAATFPVRFERIDLSPRYFDSSDLVAPSDYVSEKPGIGRLQYSSSMFGPSKLEEYKLGYRPWYAIPPGERERMLYLEQRRDSNEWWGQLGAIPK
jgi:hypothetical protein